MPEKYNFKCLGQDCDTQACHTRTQVRVTFGDVARWTTQGQIASVAGRILLTMDVEDPTMYALVLLPKHMKSDPEKLACSFYDEENKLCKINSFKPISCQTYPLEYDGKKFYVSDKDCPGVGKGEKTKEALQEAKTLAERDYNERMYTRHLLPGIYTIIVNNVMIQTEAAKRELSEEDRAKLEEIQTKMEEGVKPEEPKTGGSEASEGHEEVSDIPTSDADNSSINEE